MLTVEERSAEGDAILRHHVFQGNPARNDTEAAPSAGSAGEVCLMLGMSSQALRYSHIMHASALKLSLIEDICDDRRPA